MAANVPTGMPPRVQVTCVQRQLGVECTVATDIPLESFSDEQLDKFFDVLLCVTETTNGIPGYASKKKVPDAENERRKGAAYARYRAKADSK